MDERQAIGKLRDLASLIENARNNVANSICIEMADGPTEHLAKLQELEAILNEALDEASNDSNETGRAFTQAVSSALTEARSAREKESHGSWIVDLSNAWIELRSALYALNSEELGFQRAEGYPAGWWYVLKTNVRNGDRTMPHPRNRRLVGPFETKGVAIEFKGILENRFRYLQGNLSEFNAP